MEFGEAGWAVDGTVGGAKDARRSLLDLAIEREEWELAGLCLLLGMVKTLEELPRDAVEALLDELSELEVPPATHRRRSVRGRRRGRHA
jgi:hypothetical protein